ncbi:DNA polymerase III subunit beta [Woeseiaceae bacterium]|nr:DNA polymerase III subunit beta [Woeseiaceae bacterium]
MKIAIKREDLLKSLQSIIGVVERRQTMPILANIMLTVEGGAVTLTATDLEVELIAKISVENTDSGSLTLPGRKLLDITRSLPGEAMITIVASEGKVVVTSGKSKFSLTTLPANEFPLIPGINSEHKIKINQSELRQLIENTQFSMAQQDVRYYLNGLLLEIDGDQLKAVATDGHRLAFCQKQLSVNSPEIKSVIIPRKGVLELQRLLDGTTDIEVELGSNHIKIVFESICFTSKLIDGRFPEYQRVIPSDTSNHLLANKEDLKTSLQRTAILSNEKYRGIRLVISENEITLQAHNPEQEEAEESIDVEYSGSDIEVGFNVNYLIDALNAIDATEVSLSMVDGNSSCLITDPNDAQTKFVVMPMRL